MSDSASHDSSEANEATPPLVGVLTGEFHTLSKPAFIICFVFLQFFFNFRVNTWVGHPIESTWGILKLLLIVLHASMPQPMVSLQQLERLVPSSPHLLLTLSARRSEHWSFCGVHSLSLIFQNEFLFLMIYYYRRVSTYVSRRYNMWERPPLAAVWRPVRPVLWQGGNPPKRGYPTGILHG